MAEQFNASLKGDVSPKEAVKTLQKELSKIVEQAEVAFGVDRLAVPSAATWTEKG